MERGERLPEHLSEVGGEEAGGSFPGFGAVGEVGLGVFAGRERAQALDGLAAHGPSGNGVVRWCVEEAAEVGGEDVTLAGREFDAGADIGGELRAITGVGEEGPLEAGEGFVDACAGGARVDRPEGAEAGEGGVEGDGVGVVVLDGVLDEVGDEHGGVEAAEGEAQAWEDLGEVPLGERGEFGGGLGDEEDLPAGEELDAAGEFGVLAFGAFGDASEDAVGACEQRDGLAGLGPVPVSDADGVVDGCGHGGG